MVDLKPEVDRFINGLERLGVKALLEHVTAMTDSLSRLAITGNTALLEAIKTLQEARDGIRSAPNTLMGSDEFRAFSDKIIQTVDHLDNLIQGLGKSVAEIQPAVLETIHTVRYAVWILSGVGSFTQIGSFLNTLYSSHCERSLRAKETQAKVLHENLEYMRTFFGSSLEAIATTHILGVRATIDRFESQGVCSPGTNFKNIFIHGRPEVWHHVQAMRKRDPEIDSLFPHGIVYADSLQAGLGLAECYLSNQDGDYTEKHRPQFFGFHFVNHVDPIIPLAATVHLHEPIHVGPKLTTNRFCIIGEGGHLGPRVSISVESTLTLADGDKVPLCTNLNPQHLSNISYYGPGYGKSLARQIFPGATVGTGTGVGVAEAGMVKFGPYGLVKLITGKCIAVKLAYPLLVLVGSPVAAGGLILGYDYWNQYYRHHTYKPEELYANPNLV